MTACNKSSINGKGWLKRNKKYIKCDKLFKCCGANMFLLIASTPVKLCQIETQHNTQH